MKEGFYLSQCGNHIVEFKITNKNIPHYRRGMILSEETDWITMDIPFSEILMIGWELLE